MDPVTISSLVSAGTSLLGGLFNKGDGVATQTRKQLESKYNFAVKHGLHPLAVLGTNTSLYSPTMSVGDGIAQAGQHVGRAAEAYASRGDRASATALLQLQLERGQLENDLLRTQIMGARQALVSQPGSGPGIGGATMIPGQGDARLVVSQPMKRTATVPGQGHQEPGVVPDMGYAQTATGGYAPIRSQDVADRQADDKLEELIWNLRNRIMPSVGANYAPPQGGKSDRGTWWIYDPLRQEYVQRPVEDYWDVNPFW